MDNQNLQKNEYFSIENQRIFTEIAQIILNSKQIIRNKQKSAQNFQKFIGQEIYWILSNWIELLFKQNFTYVNKSDEQNIYNLLYEMKLDFEVIQDYINQLKEECNSCFKIQLERNSPYAPQTDTINGISECLKRIFDLGCELAQQQLIKLSYDKNQCEQFLCFSLFEEHQLAAFDKQFSDVQELYQTVLDSKDVFRVDIAYIMMSLLYTKLGAIEVQDFYNYLECFCQDHNIKLSRDVHIKKFQLYLDFDNKGRIKKEDIDDFFSFVWCNPLERYKFINDPCSSVEETKPNSTKLLLSHSKISKNSDTNFPKTIYIDQYGYWSGNKGREKIRKPVRKTQNKIYFLKRFGRQSINNFIPLDIAFGQKEVTISKRQFVIKPDYNEYYVYCISTANPTDFLVQKDGAYITKDSVITFNDKICLVVTECVVMGDEEINDKKQIKLQDDLDEGPTQRRGQKYNPAIVEFQEKEKNLQRIANQKQTEEDTKNDKEIKEDNNKSYKMGGLNDMRQYFQMRINNNNPIDIHKENGEKHINKQNENHLNQTQTDNRVIPNRELVFNDTKMKDKYYLQFRLEYCDYKCEEQLIQAIVNFNESAKKTNKKQFCVGNARGSAIWIDDPNIKEFQAYFMYNENENRWMVKDPDNQLMANAVQKDQYTTVGFKGSEDIHHSVLYKLQKGSTIVVSGNFFDVDLVEVDLEKMES